VRACACNEYNICCIHPRTHAPPPPPPLPAPPLICINTNTHIHIRPHTHRHMHIHTHAHTHTHIHTRTHTHEHKHTQIHYMKLECVNETIGVGCASRQQVCGFSCPPRQNLHDVNDVQQVSSHVTDLVDRSLFTHRSLFTYVSLFTMSTTCNRYSRMSLICWTGLFSQM